MNQPFKNINPCSSTSIKKLRYLLLFCVQAFYCFSFSQIRDLKFEYLGIETGLSYNNVNYILQDSRGFMWFGTSDGLNKYDGYQFTVYKNKLADQNSLSGNSVKSIIEDSKEVLWIGTWGGGLNKFDREKNRFIHFRHDPLNNNSISSDFVTSLLEDKKGNLWIGTEKGGLDLFDRLNNRFIHYSHGAENKTLGNVFVTAIFEDSENNLWISTIKGGLSLFDRKSSTFTKYQHNESDSGSLENNDISAIFEDSRKNLWIGTNDGGLDQLDRKTRKFSHFKNSLLAGNVLRQFDILAIKEDYKGVLLIGTRNEGLFLFNPLTGVSMNYRHDELDITSLKRNIVSNIYKDPKGNIWIGTIGGGVNFLNSTGSDFTHYKHNSSSNSLSDNDVTCIYEDSEKNLWIATDGGGLNLFDRKSGRFIHYRHQAGNKNSICGDNVLSICEDSKGNLWIGTWGAGITVFNKNKNTYQHFKNDPLKPNSLGNDNAWIIFKDREKNIWIGTYGGGLDLYNPGSDSFTHFQYDEKNSSGINNNYVVTIIEDNKGIFWIGTDGGGLTRFDKKEKKFLSFTHNDSLNSLSYNFVGHIFEDRNGNLYLTTGTGLDYFNTNTHHFTAYTANEGFTSDAASGILEDANGNLWISTSKGISLFNPSTKFFKNFNTEDGLDANLYKAPASCKSSSGVMYFGGVNGFDEFLPGKIKIVSFDPPIVITDFQVFNKKVPIAIDKNDPSPLKKNITETKSITIPYSSSVISFEFASLHYGVLERKQYAYKLEGFDKTWNEVGTRHNATYTNLDPGKYIFKVKGLNNEGKWSSNIASIQLTITPPFWLTWWFITAISLAVAGSIIAFYLFRINTVKAQKTKLQQQVHDQTIQLILSAEEEHKARQEAENARIETEQANKELILKNKELEQFVYVASHDLQEPLRTTSSFVELIKQQYHGKMDKMADKYLDFISDASDRMKVLIKDLLDFSRIGKNVELEKVDCNIIMKNMLLDIMVTIQESKTEIQYTELPVIDGYPTEIKLLFQNLVINAIKFRNKDSAPRIKISAQKKGGYWEFAVTDNGIGMEKQYSERIFVIFQRLHTRREYNGSGIGLSHCKKIVELHGGKIWVNSMPGQGSTFHFTLASLKTVLPVLEIR